MNPDWKPWYAALKSRDPEVFRKAITYSEAHAINFDLPHKQAAEIERSFVMFACELLGVKP